MIVDDEPLVRRGILSLVDFSQLNITKILEAKNGEEALRLYKEEKPNIILADINMPKMDGLSFSEIVKKDNNMVKIALITGYDYFDYAVQALKIGVDDYVLKPVTKNDVMEVLKKLVVKLELDLKRDEIEKNVSTILKDVETDELDSYKARIQKVLDAEMTNSQFSLKMLGEALGYSSNYLSGVFKKLYGVTFQDYLLNTRLEKSKILLLTTDLKNYEIASAIGFEDANYFGTRFKKQYGESPKQYKERVKSSENTSV